MTPRRTNPIAAGALLLVAALLLVPPGGWQALAQRPSEQSVVYEASLQATAGASASTAVAARATPIQVILIVPPGADTGVYIDTSGATPTTSSALLFPGQTIKVTPLNQAIKLLRAGSVDVAVGIIIGKDR